MTKSKRTRRRAPSENALWIVGAVVILASGLVVGTGAVTSGTLSMSPWLAIAEATLIIAALGLLAYLACRDRPGWPQTEMAKDGERTRMLVEDEWRRALVFAQNMTWKMERELKRKSVRGTPHNRKEQVVLQLSSTAIKSTKAAIASLQAGFPESGIREWRTLFEIGVNTSFIARRNPRVAERFVAWGRMNELSRTDPESDKLKEMKKRWVSRHFKPDDPKGWTGNPPRSLMNRARDIGLDYGINTRELTQMDVYKLANSFVHSDWTASSTTMGMSSVADADGTAEGIGEVLYLVMEAAVETIKLSASEDFQAYIEDDLWELRLLIRMAPERLRGRFVRLPLTEPLGILPDGRILIGTVKRREEWPEEAERRSRLEIRDLWANLQDSTGRTSGQSSPASENKRPSNRDR